MLAWKLEPKVLQAMPKYDYGKNCFEIFGPLKQRIGYKLTAYMLTQNLVKIKNAIVSPGLTMSNLVGQKSSLCFVRVKKITI